MGLFDFVADIGNKIFDSEDEGGEKLKAHIEQDNPGVSELEIDVKDRVAKVKGKAADQSAFQKLVLMAGNALGISEVNADDVEVPPAAAAEPQVDYYTIAKGDNLWAISKKFYGAGGKYTRIFEENREVIKDPDLIFPGQKIRIPKET